MTEPGLREALTSLVRQYHAQNVNADERAHRLVHRSGSHLNCHDHFCRATTAALLRTTNIEAAIDGIVEAHNVEHGESCDCPIGLAIEEYEAVGGMA